MCDMYLIGLVFFMLVFFFFKQKTAYEMRISDWSSDVCSSDLARRMRRPIQHQEMTTRSSFRVKDAERPAAFVIVSISSAISPNMGSSAFRKAGRSEERRVGKACVSTCRSRWSPYL